MAMSGLALRAAAALRGSSRSFHSTAARSTTVLCVRKDGEAVLVADGQVTQGSSVVKRNVRKARTIGDKVAVGYAGATADAFALFERLEGQLNEHPGQLLRASVELAKQWRTDRVLRRLDASLVVADAEVSLQVTGDGNVIEPQDGILSIGSGSPYAVAAARALADVPGLDAEAIARRAMTIAADTCIYTNDNFVAYKIDKNGIKELEGFGRQGKSPEDKDREAQEAEDKAKHAQAKEADE